MDPFRDIESVLEVWSARHGLEAAVEAIDPSLGEPDFPSRAEFSEAELSILEGHRHPHRRASWVAGRLAARRAVASWCRRHRETAPPVRILRRASGSPYLEGRPDLHVSISHAGTLAVAAVCDRPIGLDLERLEERPDALVRFFFSPSEQDWIRRIPSEAFRRCNFLWTRKEAVSKLLGRGGDLFFARLPVLDGKGPWIFDSAATPTHALSLAMDRI